MTWIQKPYMKAIAYLMIVQIFLNYINYNEPVEAGWGSEVKFLNGKNDILGVCERERER